jgi:hypothetical protein
VRVPGPADSSLTVVTDAKPPDAPALVRTLATATSPGASLST